MTKADILAYSNTNIRVKTDPSSVSTDNVATSIDNCAENFANADLTADDNRTHLFGANSLDIVAGDADFVDSTSEIFVNAAGTSNYSQTDTTHHSSVNVNASGAIGNSYSGDDVGLVSIAPALVQLQGSSIDHSIVLSIAPTSIQVTKDALTSKNVCYLNIADDFVNDAAAAIGGIAVGELYHTSGVPKIRLS